MKKVFVSTWTLNTKHPDLGRVVEADVVNKIVAAGYQVNSTRIMWPSAQVSDGTPVGTKCLVEIDVDDAEAARMNLPAIGGEDISR